jgi:excisionase family DNA binding protein
MRRIILSTADVARLFSVTETTVKRWADDGALRCQKTPGGHRKFEIRSVVAFAEKNQFDPAGVLAFVGDKRFAEDLQVAILSRDYSALVRTYVQRALSTDTTDLFAFLSFLYEHRISLAEICDRVLRPGMTEIGDLWAAGTIGINHEHRASYETMDALAKLQTEVRIKPANGQHVLCACLGEELHEIGLRCAANIFESEGWTVHYLGARTPVEAVVESIRELHPNAVSISITNPVVVERIAAELAAACAAIDGAYCRLFVGGAAASRIADGAGVTATVLDSIVGLESYLTRTAAAAAGSKTIHEGRAI